MMLHSRTERRHIHLWGLGEEVKMRGLFQSTRKQVISHAEPIFKASSFVDCSEALHWFFSVSTATISVVAATVLPWTQRRTCFTCKEPSTEGNGEIMGNESLYKQYKRCVIYSGSSSVFCPMNHRTLTERGRKWHVTVLSMIWERMRVMKLERERFVKP